MSGYHKRRKSTDSDTSSTNENELNDNVSVVSESFRDSNLRMHQPIQDENYICGYLLKKSQDGVWQKRFFETNSTFLTYYKSKKRTKLLAALNMPNVGQITLVGNTSDSLGDGVVFQLELKDRNYILRSPDLADAQRWMIGLQKLRDAAKAQTIIEEPAGMDESRGSTPVKPASSSGPAEVESAPRGDWGKQEKKSGCGSCVIL
mmetsp:Transcript_23123/g.33874  ORF Transcript_23123/g.33874 Transcript_23123/m.33874 type:complete len:204 (-) Transcript_23123:221-832(-)|eukprot:CAMPEP_0185040836 /NCGR_PEP_ID=MMETSP1103-20130426/39387_1 /TAXON_ID=36769 /ORGANISM="Paraphysomonas bandaiensis, Strain Caron Lab Isolate" /LENGTH=203 /DNA_ID=CAMNT_0027580295 /DNA_START=64 /DNA_END=675 /DNA_ORIENTATION=+